MALFQPSNITPSSFAGGGNGVVDVNDPVSISWQVNGNSPMQAFKIAIYTNDAQSQFVANMPISTDGCPFYGTDSKGNFRTFQYQETSPWNVFFGSSFENGTSYKIVITQYWGTFDNDTNTWSNSVVQLSPSVFITRDKPVISIPNFGDINSIKGSWTASYFQAQGDAVAWCRWRLAQGSTNNVIDDTGVLYTGDLAYEYDGLISDANYTYYLKLTVETENGVQATTGWQSFQSTYNTESLGNPLSVKPVADSSILVTLYDNSLLNEETTYLYKSSANAPALSQITSIPQGVDFIKIFSQRSLESLDYSLIIEEESGGQTTYKASETSNIVCMRISGYYLIEAMQDENISTLYHAVRVWKFGNNIDVGSYSNNNTPNFLTNFTPYRLRQPTSRMGKSGTLQALLSNVRNNAYQDSSWLMDELFNLSVTPNSLFLKDMKGNLYMIHTSAPITQTVNTKSCQQQVTVSIPWEEVGDASDVSIIQLSTDENFTEGDCSINLTPIA